MDNEAAGRDAAASEPPFDADEAAEARYGLTALGEAVLGCVEDRGRPGRARFRGFGPCAAVA